MQRHRDAAINRRMRVRQVQRWRRERESEAIRERRLAFLRELSGRIDAGFSSSDLMDAQAALSENPSQRALPLRGGR